MIRNAQRGEINPFFILIMFGLGVWAAILVATVYWDKYDLQRDIEDLASQGLKLHSSYQADFERKVFEAIVGRKGQISKRDVTIEFGFDQEYVKIQFPYRRSVDFGFYQHEFLFDFNISEVKRAPGGVIGEVHDKVEDSNLYQSNKYSDAIKKSFGK